MGVLPQSFSNIAFSLWTCVRKTPLQKESSLRGIAFSFVSWERRAL